MEREGGDQGLNPWGFGVVSVLEGRETVETLGHGRKKTRDETPYLDRREYTNSRSSRSQGKSEVVSKTSTPLTPVLSIT